MYACNGILFNHESPRRGETFVTRRITRALVSIKLGFQNVLYLGNIYAKRDWGHAMDYVEIQWLMLQQHRAYNNVTVTGEQYSVKEFIERAAKYLDMKLRWSGHGEDEVGTLNGKISIRIDPRYYRPSEVETLLGDPTKAKTNLNWSPKISFQELVEEMIDEDLNQIKNSNNKT